MGDSAAAGPVVVAAVLLAAVLHASWNAIAKNADDRLGMFVRTSLLGVVLSVPLMLVAPLPDRSAWVFLLGSAVVHTLYNVGLLASYRLGDFNQTYPLARGLGPLLVAVVAVLVLDESLGLPATLGVACIAGAIGVLGLTPWRRVREHRRAVVAALLTGVAIASYTLLDGVGVRRGGSALAYTAWLFGVHLLLTVVSLAVAREVLARRTSAPRLRASARAWGLAVGAAGMSMAAYGLVLWAQTRGALAAVAALRESSVVVAALIGVVFFKEPLGRVRVAAASAVALGVVLLALPT